ncbi:MAG: hypothetical protein CMJ00_02315 [Pelagibacteraceae bacterium]|nr:hypothetical protein [Pelagibacteraceae bacterium]|tara:strand:- start:245 stop:673 length:429 start_codon:yes stop_codon:yes gene_type:complete
MKKILFLLSLVFLLNGCAETIALIGTSTSNGKIVQSSLNSAISYGVKKQTGKTPLEHAIAYAERINPEKEQETCITSIERTRSEFCTVVKKQISLTNNAIKRNTLDIVKKYPKEITSSIKAKIKETSLIEDIAKKSVIYNRR